MTARRAVVLTIAAVLALAVAGFFAYQGKKRFDRAVARAEQAEAVLASVPPLRCEQLQPEQVCSWPAEIARRESRAFTQGQENGIGVGWQQACMALRDVIEFEECLNRQEHE